MVHGQSGHNRHYMDSGDTADITWTVGTQHTKHRQLGNEEWGHGQPGHSKLKKSVQSGYSRMKRPGQSRLEGLRRNKGDLKDTKNQDKTD